MPNEHQELMFASPNMAKGLHGLPNWLIKKENSNDLLLSTVVKYFTFQALVWHLEGDNEAMSNYFLKVSDVFVCLFFSLYLNKARDTQVLRRPRALQKNLKVLLGTLRNSKELQGTPRKSKGL